MRDEHITNDISQVFHKSFTSLAQEFYESFISYLRGYLTKFHRFKGFTSIMYYNKGDIAVMFEYYCNKEVLAAQMFINSLKKTEVV
ncbi:hypothetical protein AGMMS49936_09990 [Endomicrobiia bacterium]|nr:hypothetical protein AGMMS49936_09990 [Endomicrobiia bacterium]